MAFETISEIIQLNEKPHDSNQGGDELNTLTDDLFKLLSKNLSRQDFEDALDEVFGKVEVDDSNLISQN